MRCPIWGWTLSHSCQRWTHTHGQKGDCSYRGVDGCWNDVIRALQTSCFVKEVLDRRLWRGTSYATTFISCWKWLTFDPPGTSCVVIWMRHVSLQLKFFTTTTNNNNNKSLTDLKRNSEWEKGKERERHPHLKTGKRKRWKVKWLRSDGVCVRQEEEQVLRIVVGRQILGRPDSF